MTKRNVTVTATFTATWPVDDVYPEGSSDDEVRQVELENWTADPMGFVDMSDTTDIRVEVWEA